MTLTARFMTTERIHLFEMTQRLVAAIDDDIWHDPARPLQVALRGTARSGKNIFADAAREILFDRPPFFEGRVDYDEVWSGTHAGSPLQMTFINAAWPGGYDNKAVNNAFLTGTKIKRFLAQRSAGGMDMVQNSASWSRHAGLTVYIEKENGIAEDYGDPRYKQHPAASGRIFTYGDLYPWLRYVEIVIEDPRLLRSANFRAAFDAFAPVQGESLWQRSLHPLRTREYPVPVYGIDIKRNAP